MEISRAKELVKEKLPDKRYQHSLQWRIQQLS